MAKTADIFSTDDHEGCIRASVEPAAAAIWNSHWLLTLSMLKPRPFLIVVEGTEVRFSTKEEVWAEQTAINPETARQIADSTIVVR